MEIRSTVIAVRRQIAQAFASTVPLVGGVVTIVSEVVGNGLTLAYRSDAGLVVSFAVAKIVLQRLSAIAQGNSWSLGGALLSGIFNGLGFITGAASAACLAFTLGSRRAKLGGTKGVMGVAMLFFVVMHIFGRKLTRRQSRTTRAITGEPQSNVPQVVKDSAKAPLHANPVRQPRKLPPPVTPIMTAAATPTDTSTVSATLKLRTPKVEPPVNPIMTAVATPTDPSTAGATLKLRTPKVEQPGGQASDATIPSKSPTGQGVRLEPTTPVRKSKADAPIFASKQEEAQQLMQQAEHLRLDSEQLLTPPSSPSERGAAAPDRTPTSSPTGSKRAERTPIADTKPSSPGTPWQVVDKDDEGSEPSHSGEDRSTDEAAFAPAEQVQQELFVDPTIEELHAHGEWLVGRRVSVKGYGPGTVVAFQKTYGRGASRHLIKFDKDDQQVAVKLARKTNTDPQKKPWKVVSPPRPGGK
jgi:hypothetical protein